MGSQFIGTQFTVSRLMRAPSPQVAGSGETVRFSMQRQRVPSRCVKRAGTGPGVTRRVPPRERGCVTSVGSNQMHFPRPGVSYAWLRSSLQEKGCPFSLSIHWSPKSHVRVPPHARGCPPWRWEQGGRQRLNADGVCDWPCTLLQANVAELHIHKTNPAPHHTVTGFSPPHWLAV